MNKTTRLIFSLLMSFSITACVSPKDSNESSKEDATTVYPTSYYQIDDNKWDELFKYCKCLNPFSNFTVFAKNAGVLLCGGTDVKDIFIKFDNGKVYVDEFRDSYYIFKEGSNVEVDEYSVRMYQEDINEITGNTWELKGEGNALVSDIIGLYATICFTTRSLKYNEFTFDEEDNVYTCPSFTSYCSLLPGNRTYAIENMKIQFLDGQISYFDYFVKEYNLQLTSSFINRGTTVVEAPNIPVE